MMRIVLLLALLALVYSFSSPLARSMKLRSSLQMGFEKEIGVQPPLGLWDPLGLLKNADQERFATLRKYETKHGRIAMLAVLGHIVTAAGIRAHGDIAFGVPFSSVKAGLGVFDTIPAAGIAQIIAFIGILEFGFEYQEKNIEEECKSRAKEWGWSDAEFKRRQTVELNNGRAAQMGILGLIVHEKLDGNAYVLNSLLGAPVHY